MPKVLNERVQSLDMLAPSIYKMTLESQYIAQNAQPGQFVNVKCGEGLNALLRRPISICRVDREKGTFDMVFRVKGTGTEILSQKTAGSSVDFIGPLGSAFHISDEYGKIAVIGGGIGIFPLLFLLEEYKSRNMNLSGYSQNKSSAFIGFRNMDCIVLDNEFKNACDCFHMSTEDGFICYKGFVTDLLEQNLIENRYDIIYTCGPTPMIKKVAEIAGRNSIKCQVSLEQRMGCGIGACLVCACKTRFGDGWEYSHVCKDGPVFWSDEVIWEE